MLVGNSALRSKGVPCYVADTKKEGNYDFPASCVAPAKAGGVGLQFRSVSSPTGHGNLRTGGTPEREEVPHVSMWYRPLRREVRGDSEDEGRGFLPPYPPSLHEGL